MYWNAADGGFDLADLDTGYIATGPPDIQWPWGPTTWGVQGQTFGGAWTVFLPWGASKGPIAGQRYYIRDGRAYLYGKEDAGRYGFVRYILGNVWTAGRQTPTPLPLYPDSPTLAQSFAIQRRRIERRSMNLNLRDSLPSRPLTDIRPLRLELALYRGATILRSGTASRAMYAINLWLTGPHFPTGGDVIRRKPLVFDLAFHTEGTFLHDGLRSFESPACFHYQEAVGPAPLSSWKKHNIDLKPIILRALRMFALPPEGAAICQLEFVIELVNGEGSAMIDNFYLSY